MIGVRSCRLFKRSCCAMSQKPLHLSVPRMTALLRLLATSSTRNGTILWVSEPKCMRDVSTKYGSHVAVVSIFFIFDVIISFWLATPDCCMYGLFEIDCVRLWILYFLLISSFQLTEASTFWHKHTIAYDGWRPDMTYMWNCCQGKSFWDVLSLTKEIIKQSRRGTWFGLTKTDSDGSKFYFWDKVRKQHEWIVNKDNDPQWSECVAATC